VPCCCANLARVCGIPNAATDGGFGSLLLVYGFMETAGVAFIIVLLNQFERTAFISEQQIMVCADHRKYNGRKLPLWLMYTGRQRGT